MQITEETTIIQLETYGRSLKHKELCVGLLVLRLLIFIHFSDEVKPRSDSFPFTYTEPDHALYCQFNLQPSIWNARYTRLQSNEPH